jgi:putative FmdB family regulatory protein
MPTYGYRCPNGHEVDVIHGMVDAPPTAGEVCGATPIHRIFHPISVSFTGSGFYATDYGQGKEKSVAAGSASDSVKASDDSAKKTDEKARRKPTPRGNS